MLKNLIVLPDGTELFSGVGTENAIARVRLTQRVNAGTDLTLGSACAAMLEATLFTPAGALHIPTGTELTLYKVNGAGVRTQVGLFTVEKTAHPSANRYTVTAYDRVSRLDRDLTQWLDSLDAWPYTLLDFARLVCSACNVTLANQDLPNGQWQVQKFTAGAISGRRLMQWIGEACGRFCRATPDGQLELAWYTPGNVIVTPNGEHFIFEGSLLGEDYQVAPVDRVVIRAGEKDTGTAYGSGSNGYVITGNPLLAADSQEAVQAVAEMLYELLHGITYTPCRVTVPATTRIQAGDILQVTDKNGRTVSVYVMSREQTGQRDTLVCTGNPRRDSVTSVHNFDIRSLDGRILELSLGLDGLRAENKDADGKLTALQMSVDGISTKVSQQQADLEGVDSRVSTVEQTAEGLSVRVKSVYDDGVSRVSTAAGYTFDENGITVKKSGKEIETQITEDGMTVYKNGNAVLTANSQGVNAVDLHASTYLIVAGKSRFERYKSTRIGCFWIGG